MTKFVSNPNLPQNPVCNVIMSNVKENLVKELKNYSINVIHFTKLDTISGSEAYHADMGICHIGREKIMVCKNINSGILKELEHLGFNIIKSNHNVTAKKPSLNICILGKNIICNTKSADKNIIEYADKLNLNMIHTNQHYAKCSSAVVNENALITADESIYQSCLKNKIDVLKISCGGIELEGYQYGFIGGTCGLISKNILAFCGNIKLHKDYENIKTFTKNYSIELLSLSNDKLYDIGGILPVTEY